MLKLTPREKRKIEKEIFEDAVKTKEYKNLSARKFRDKNGYLPYDMFCKIVAAQLHVIDMGCLLGKDQDPIWTASIHSFWDCQNYPDFPVYAISEELLEAFLLTDVPKISNIHVPFQRALIMLPKNMIKSPTGISLDWVYVCFMEPYEEIWENGFMEYIDKKTNRENIFDTRVKEKIHLLRLKWVTILDEEVFQSTIAIGDNEIEFPENLQLDNDEEKIFVKKITEFIYLTMVYLQKPKKDRQLIEVQPSNSNIGFGGGLNKKSETKPIKNYIWIGKEYKRDYVPKGGTHRSPTEHPRRGHLRFLEWKPEGEQTIWIRPTMVNVGKK